MTTDTIVRDEALVDFDSSKQTFCRLYGNPHHIFSGNTIHFFREIMLSCSSISMFKYFLYTLKSFFKRSVTLIYLNVISTEIWAAIIEM